MTVRVAVPARLFVSGLALAGYHGYLKFPLSR
jgi:hypothetical protein